MESLAQRFVRATLAVVLIFGAEPALGQSGIAAEGAVAISEAEVNSNATGARQDVAGGGRDFARVPVVPSGEFFGAGLIVPDRELMSVGRLVEVVGPTVVRRRAPPQIQPYDRVLVRLTGPVAAGDRLHLMRPGRHVPGYGRIHMATGTGLVLSVTGGVATIEVDGFYDRVAVGDAALPMPEYLVRVGEGPRPASGLEGRVLALAHPQPIVATDDEAFVDLGAASGVVEGDEFEVYLPGTATPWGMRPEVVVARLQVIRAGRLTSAVRVVALQYPALEAGLPVRLVARMP